LSCNSISSEGLDIFIKTLRGGAGKYVETLDLSYNNLGDDGVFNLAKAFEANQLPRLKHLILKEVGAGPASLQKLFESFQHGIDIESLDISGNSFAAKPRKKGKKSYYPNSKMLQSVTGILGKWKENDNPRKTSKGISKHRKITREKVNLKKSPLRPKKSKAKGANTTKEVEQSTKTVKSLMIALESANKLSFVGLLKVGLSQKQKDALSERGNGVKYLLGL